MDAITRNVRDIDPTDREALEHVIGESLREDQQIEIKVLSVIRSPQPQSEPSNPPAEPQVPEWWHVYEGLSDEEIDRLDRAIRERADLTRHCE
jgi:hypothetical protein